MRGAEQQYLNGIETTAISPHSLLDCLEYAAFTALY